MNSHVLARVRQFASAAALSGTLVAAGTPAFAEEAAALDGKGISAFTLGLRQTLTESGLTHAVGAAASWMGQLEIGLGSSRDMRPSLGLLALETNSHAIPVNPAAKSRDRAPAAAGGNNAFDDPPHTQHRLSLATLSQATVASLNHSFALGHAQSNLGAEMSGTALDPASYLAGGTTRGPVIGLALAEHSLSGHDIELGLPVPYLDGARIAAARYWWGDGVFTPLVEGTRVSLKMDLTPHIQFEGGATQDPVHGRAGFVGLRYSVSFE
ncbi:MAG TPA: hypothetical protein VK690_03835 [Stellaceae bacterium]|nr:hypothetical protein [Stellaceae bacterium]